MKKNKLLAYILSMTMLLSACGGESKPAENNEEPKPTEVTETAETEETTEEEPVEETEEEKTEVAEGEESFEGSAKGYNGDITVNVNFDGDKITGIVVDHDETPGLGEEAIKKLVPQMVDGQSVEVDNVSGATSSSEGLKEAVKAAIIASGRDVSKYAAAVSYTHLTLPTT